MTSGTPGRSHVPWLAPFAACALIMCGARMQEGGRMLKPMAPGEDIDKPILKRAAPADSLGFIGEAGGVSPDPVELMKKLGKVLEELEDASYAQREAAMQELIEQCGGSADALRVVLEGLPLTAEQHQRVLAGLRESLVSRPRGALGISMQFVVINPDLGGEIIVTGLVPDLPAERILRLGDRIASLDGMRIYRQSDLIAHVQSKLPGETVHLVVRRFTFDEQGRPVMKDGQQAYETLELDIELGSAELLRQDEDRQPPSPVVLTRMAQASAAVQALAIRPRHVEFQEGEGEDLQLIIDTSDAAVENHPAIRQLLLEKRLINEGRMPMTEELAREWDDRVRLLMIEASDPAATAMQLALANAVLERYLELLSQ